MAHRGLGLQLHIELVVVDVEIGAGGIVDAPDDDRGDLDRVAALVVDLEPLAVEVAGAERYLAARVERIRPAQPRHPRRAPVGAEELEDRRLVGLQRIKTGEHERRGDEDERAFDERPDAGRAA